jgi:hypothetical protein
VALRALPLTAPLVGPLVLAALGASAPPGLRAQTDVALELGASQVGPASGLETGDARFAIGGLRISSHGGSGSGVFASVLGGQAFGDSVGGSFVSAFAEGSLVDRWSAAWSGAVDLKVLGFAVADPYPYRTVAAELTPSVRYRAAHASIELGLLGGVGRSNVERTGRLGRTRVFEDDHWRLGTTGELLVGSQTVQVGLAGSTHRASGEDYHSAGARLVTGGGWGVVELRADRWETPLGWETTGGLALAIPFGGDWSFRGFFGRSDPDPLTLTQPGSGSGGALLGWSLYNDRPAARAPLHELLERTETGSRIRLSVEAPEGARVVQLMGDFTRWEAVAMRPEGDRWVAEIEVGVGAHHFGFLVDDEWYLPDDAPDVVPDEWGRASATLVIEGAGR